MKARILFIIMLSACLSVSIAQSVSINDNGAPADVNAILDIDVSTNDKGILIPRLTTAQIASLGSVTQGMMVYNETISDFQYYNGTSWITVGNTYISNRIQDTDQNTKIQTEESPNENIIRFDINGAEAAVLTSTGLGIGTGTPSAKLDVEGSFQLVNGSQGANKYLVSDASGNATWTSNININGSMSMKVRTINSATTVLDNDNVLVCANSTGSYTVTLPTAVGISGRIYSFKKLGSGYQVTLDGLGSQTIDGSITYTLTAAYKSVRLISDGSNWLILGGF